MLHELRVLDLTSDFGLLCGHLLAQMGAQVTHWVDPSEELTHEPAVQALCHDQHLVEQAWHQQPQTLDQTLPDYDVLILGDEPHTLAERGIVPSALLKQHPRLIVVAISGFGLHGNPQHIAHHDLLVTAASGWLHVTGAQDAAPLRMCEPQAQHHAAADAAVGAVIAWWHQRQTQRGQLVDASAQHSLTLALLNRGLDAAVGQDKAQRSAYGVALGPVFVRTQFAAKDGWVLVMPGILPSLVGFMQRMVDWAIEAELLPPETADYAWGSLAQDLVTGVFSAEQWQQIEQALATLVSRHSKQELMQIAMQRRLLIAPVFSLQDLLQSEHLQQRGWLGGSAQQPRLGPFAQMSHTPMPVAAEHAAADVEWTQPQALPLSGVKILDLYWVVAGPGATRMLADYGASVVHVENRAHPDTIRVVAPYIDGIPELERAAAYHSTNCNKHNITLNLTTADGMAVLEDLVRWADVVTESFAPGVMERLGLDEQRLRQLNPNVIFARSCLMGQTGSWSSYAGFGNLAAAVTGFHNLVGQPDQPPTGCFGPYTDFTSVRFNALAILLALEFRRRTGQGQTIDMSQAESALLFLAPAVQRYFTHGELPRPQGNRHPQFCPHGVFGVAGEERWMAIVVDSDAAWRSLCELADWPDWSDWSLTERQAHEDQIEAGLNQWCADQSAEALQSVLCRHGIGAQCVLNTHDLHADERLIARGMFHRIEHPMHGYTGIEGSRIVLSEVAARVPLSAPTYGADNDFVLRELLGYDEDTVARLHAGEGLH